MAEQTFKNHGRIHPAYHFVVMPVFLANIVAVIVRAVRQPSAWHVWQVVVAAALLLLAGVVRTYALRVQDRVIRLEERIRMAALLPLELHPLQRELTTGQIIALRFASDAELAGLIERTVREKLAPKQIKAAIVNWRPDTHRV